jgi:cyanate lyase
MARVVGQGPEVDAVAVPHFERPTYLEGDRVVVVMDGKFLPYQW